MSATKKPSFDPRPTLNVRKNDPLHTSGITTASKQREKRKLIAAVESIANNYISREEIYQVLLSDKARKCCERQGCLLKQFLCSTSVVPNYEAAIDYIMQIRNLSIRLDHGEREAFVISTVRSCIAPSHHSALVKSCIESAQRGALADDSQESNRFNFKYQLPIHLPNGTQPVVCRASFKIAYGFSFDEIRKASSLLKINLNADGYPKHVWPDNHVHEYSYAEQHLVFKDIRHRKKHGSDKYDTVQSGYEPGFYSIYSSFPF
jgi:hypothetical protein